MNKYKKIGEWLSTYPMLYNWIYFNAIQIQDGNTSFAVVPSERALKEYIDGSKDVELILIIAMVKSYDNEMSDTNYNAIEEVENFSNWIASQGEQGKYPIIEENITINKIEVVQNAPTTIVDSDSNLATYQFQIKLIYKEN